MLNIISKNNIDHNPQHTSYKYDLLKSLRDSAESLFNAYTLCFYYKQNEIIDKLRDNCASDLDPINNTIINGYFDKVAKEIEKIYLEDQFQFSDNTLKRDYSYLSVKIELCLARFGEKLFMEDGGEYRSLASLTVEKLKQLLDNPSSSEQDFIDGIQEIATLYQATLSQEHVNEPSTNWVKKITRAASHLPTQLPAEAPIKWANRKTFVVADIKDDYTRQKLEANPELEQQIRQIPDALTFFNLVWKPFVEAKLLYRLELAGQLKTATNPNPKRGFDKRLTDCMWQECKDNNLNINDYLPNISIKIDRELELAGISNNPEDSISTKRIASIASAAYKRSINKSF